MRAAKVWGYLLVLLVFAVGCQFDDPASGPVVERLDAPAAPGSGQPRLYTAADGTVWMSWLASVNDSTHALRYATITDTVWSTPTTVATGTDWFVNWADLPSVRPLPDGRAAAHYLQSNGPRGLAYAVRITQTTGGAWHEAVTPHADGTPTEHGFVSMVPWPDDRLLAVWLDGRAMSGGGRDEIALRSAVLDTNGTVQKRSLVDGRTCECCATSTVRVGTEALVAYRDRSEGEVRDISVTRFDGETWSEPTRLHADGWTIEGCPVNGPALAAQEERVVAAWFTAAERVPRVKAAFSTDGGRHFTAPVVAAEGATTGRVDAVLLDDGSAVVSWLGTADDRGRVRVRRVWPDSSVSEPVTLATLPSAARSVGFPKVVRSGGFLYGAWVGKDGATSRVQTARLPTSAVPRIPENESGLVTPP